MKVAIEVVVICNNFGTMIDGVFSRQSLHTIPTTLATAAEDIGTFIDNVDIATINFPKVQVIEEGDYDHPIDLPDGYDLIKDMLINAKLDFYATSSKAMEAGDITEENAVLNYARQFEGRDNDGCPVTVGWVRIANI